MKLANYKYKTQNCENWQINDNPKDIATSMAMQYIWQANYAIDNNLKMPDNLYMEELLLNALSQTLTNKAITEIIKKYSKVFPILSK